MARGLSVDVERRFSREVEVRAAFAPPAGDLVTVLFGPSGSGKTTTLRAVAGLERPDRGLVRFGDETWFDSQGGVSLPPQRRRVGYLFQEYALFPHLSVRANVAYGLGGLARRERDARADELAQRFGIEGLMDRRPRTLSGGEQQRVALARALAINPRLLLLDEPLSALDAPTRERLRRELRNHLRQAGVPTLLVTHDRAEALAIGDHLVVMHGGQVRQSGPVHEVFSRPVDLEVARITGVETVTPGTITAVAGGLATVLVGTARLTAVATIESGTDVYACIRAEDVTLERGERGETSASNHLPAAVRELTLEGPLMRVVLDCGFELTALVTKQSAERLELAVGTDITAVVKAPSVHLVARG